LSSSTIERTTLACGHCGVTYITIIPAIVFRRPNRSDK
jgi:hypothetical protein